MGTWRGSNHKQGPGAPRWRVALDRGHPLSKGLVGAFFSVGNTFVDLTHNKPNITRQNASGGIGIDAMAAIDVKGTSFSGGATTDRIGLGSAPSSEPISLAGLTNVSVVGWVRMDGAGNFPRIIDKSDSGNGANGWTVWGSNSSGDRSITYMVGGSGSPATPGTAFFTLGEVTLFGISVNSTTLVNFYKNGALFNSDTCSLATIPSTTTNAAIGNWNHATDRMWNGVIYNVLVYNRELSAEEHLSLYKPDTRWGFLEEYGRKSYFLGFSNYRTALATGLTGSAASGGMDTANTTIAASAVTRQNDRVAEIDFSGMTYSTTEDEEVTHTGVPDGATNDV